MLSRVCDADGSLTAKSVATGDQISITWTIAFAHA